MELDLVTTSFLSHLAARNRCRFDLEGIVAETLSPERNRRRVRAAEPRRAQ
jgi:hypothetical protein